MKSILCLIFALAVFAQSTSASDSSLTASAADSNSLDVRGVFGSRVSFGCRRKRSWRAARRCSAKAFVRVARSIGRRGGRAGPCRRSRRPHRCNHRWAYRALVNLGALYRRSIGKGWHTIVYRLKHGRCGRKCRRKRKRTQGLRYRAVRFWAKKIAKSNYRPSVIGRSIKKIVRVFRRTGVFTVRKNCRGNARQRHNCGIRRAIHYYKVARRRCSRRYKKASRRIKCRRRRELRLTRHLILLFRKSIGRKRSHRLLRSLRLKPICKPIRSKKCRAHRRRLFFKHKRILKKARKVTSTRGKARRRAVKNIVAEILRADRSVYGKK